MKKLRVILLVSIVAIFAYVIWHIFTQTLTIVDDGELMGKGEVRFSITAADSSLLSEQTIKEIRSDFCSSAIWKTGRRTSITLNDGTNIVITNLFFPEKINLIHEFKLKGINPNRLSNNIGRYSEFINGEFYVNASDVPKKISLCQYEKGKKFNVITRTEDLLHIHGNLGFLNFTDLASNSQRTIGVQFNNETTRLETVLYNSPDGLVLIIISHNKNIYLERMLNLQ